jgi:putative transcriptional regulator
MPLHHPTAALLLSVAAGEQSAAVHKVVLAHAALCAACRAHLAQLESIGGAMLEAETDVAMSPGALERALSALGAERRDSAVATTPDWLQAVPAAVLEIVAEVARTTSSKGAPSLNLMHTMAGNRETIEVVRIEPGKAIPTHAHEGTEYTLVLTGAFRDQHGVFAQGDLAITDARHTHRPVAEPGETCIALIVTTAALRFKGPLGLLQRLMTLGRG